MIGDKTADATAPVFFDWNARRLQIPMITNYRIRALAVLTLGFVGAWLNTATAQQFQLDSGFGNGGSLTLEAGVDWSTGWNDRNAHLLAISADSWVIGGSFSKFVNPDLLYQRRIADFNGASTDLLSNFSWGVGPPLSMGGILGYDDGSIGLVGTGNPGGGAVTSVHQARTLLNSGSAYSNCAGGFQANASFGPNARDEVRSASGGWFVRGAHTTVAVGTTRLANGESRGLIAQFHQNCFPDSGFGSGGAVLLDVNPFVVNAPPRAVRINSISRYLNAQAQPRLVVAGGVRYGLDAGAAGACFIAMFTTEGTLDPNFDFDGIRIYDPPVQGGGNIACDFNTVVQVGQPPNAGIATIADWKRVSAGSTVYEAAPVRFTSSGSLFADWSNNYRIGTLTERGPSTLAIRSDQKWVFGSSLLSGQAGGIPMSSGELRLLDPDSGLGLGIVSLPWSFSDNSAQVSEILPLRNNAVFVVGTSGSGRFGHSRLHVARYSDGRVALAVSVTGTGDGSITSTPPAINCTRGGGTCEALLDPGTTVTLSANPVAGSVFTGWSGAAVACNVNLSCTISIAQATIVGARFMPLVALTVANSGNGTITSNPIGIDCGNLCIAQFAMGSVVRMTATAASGFVFSGWSGAAQACGNNVLCDITINNPVVASASFVPAAQQVSINRIGSGRVLSTPAGIDCGAMCSADFTIGSSITLHASDIQGSGFQFQSWSGDAAVCGSNPMCTLLVSRALNITVTFSQQHQLVLARGGTGQGVVLSDPAGINCGATCTAAFPAFSTVTLTATANSGSRFSHWTDDMAVCADNAICAVSMDANLTGFAMFESVTDRIFASGFE